MDTINFTLYKEAVPNTDLMGETSQYLNLITGNGISYGKEVIYGKLENLEVTITEDKINVRNGSLCKYYLGDNLKELGRSGTQKAIEKLSDNLHLPMAEAEVNKFHFGINVMLTHPPNLYLPYLGPCGRFNRLVQPFGINYKVANRELAIYDKVREIKSHRQPLHPLYIDRHICRLENRYNIGIANYFNLPKVKAKLLYDEDFYISINQDLQNTYQQINKIKKIKIDMNSVTKISEVYKMAMLLLIENEGGLIQALENIKERYKKGLLTKKQHHDLKAVYQDSCKMKIQTIESDLIIELDGKVKEKFRYYR